MFGPDPINLADPSPYGPLAYYGHLLIGAVIVIAALSALFARKGSPRHIWSGRVFLVGLLFVSLTSISMLSNVFIPPLFMAVFTAIYAAGGAWLALRDATKRVKLTEWALLVFEIAGLCLFLSIAIPAAAAGTIPPFAPAVIAFIPLVLIAGDINWFLNQNRRRELRVRRHLARMVWAFVVVIRAPMVELAAAGLPISQPLTIFGPILLALVLILYFQRKHGGRGAQNPKAASSRSTAGL